jgi:hypothetical protein
MAARRACLIRSLYVPDSPYLSVAKGGAVAKSSAATSCSRGERIGQKAVISRRQPPCPGFRSAGPAGRARRR